MTELNDNQLSLPQELLIYLFCDGILFLAGVAQSV
jgi:hypothetical protein